jgi:uncharacterized membrane protein YkoI
MCSRLIATLFLALAQATLVANVASAQNLVDPRKRDRDEDRANQSARISLDEAVRMVESRYRARAVKADPVNSGGRLVYEIRLLNDEGKVWKVRVDAETGRSY